MSGWASARDKDGREYYYHTRTLRTMWNHPQTEELQLAAEHIEAMVHVQRAQYLRTALHQQWERRARHFMARWREAARPTVVSAVAQAIESLLGAQLNVRLLRKEVESHEGDTRQVDACINALANAKVAHAEAEFLRMMTIAPLPEGATVSRSGLCSALRRRCGEATRPRLFFL